MQMTPTVEGIIKLLANTSIVLSKAIAEADKVATPLEMGSILNSKIAVLQAAQYISTVYGEEGGSNDASKSGS